MKYAKNRSIAMRIRIAREKLDITQEELAKRIGASQQAVQSWEVGRTTPRGLVRCNRLAEVLGIPLKELANPEEPSLLIQATPATVTADSYDAIDRERRGHLTETSGKLKEALPPELKPYANATLATPDGYPFEFSYVSDKCVVTVVAPDEVVAGIISNVQPRISIYKEIQARRALGETEPNKRHYAVLFVHEGSGGIRLSSGLISEAKLANVEIEVLYSYDDAAKRIAELELLPTQAQIAALSS